MNSLSDVYECVVAQPWQATARSPSSPSSSSSSSPHGFVSSLRFVLPFLCLCLCVYLLHLVLISHGRTDGRTVVDGDRVACSTIHSNANANAIAQLTSTTQSNNNAAATALPLNFLSYSFLLLLLLLLLARDATPRRSIKE